MLCELSPKARLELASMAYARWSNAYDSLKNTKTITWESQNKFCPKADWPSFHADMVASAQKELDIATLIKDEMCKYSPIVTGE